MSSYLCFKKGNAELSSHSSGTEIYAAFIDVLKFTDEWQPLSPAAISSALQNLREKIESKEREIRIHKNMCEHHLTYEELFEEITAIQDMEDNIKQIQIAAAQIMLYLEIANDVEISDNEEPQPLMYAYL